MRRRKFIALLPSAVAWPVVSAQQQEKPATIGFLGQSTRLASSEWVVAFVERLRELRWFKGRNVAIDYQWAEGRSEDLAEITAKLLRSKVDIIVTSGSPQVLAVKQATSAVPIVIATAVVGTNERERHGEDSAGRG